MRKLFFYLFPVAMLLAISEQTRVFSVLWTFLFAFYPFWACILDALRGEGNPQPGTEEGWIPIANQKHDI